MKTKRVAFDCVRNMPPLRHKVGEVFDPNKSEVVDWIVSQPEVREYIMRTCREMMTFNPGSGTWSGIDHKPPKQDWNF